MNGSSLRQLCVTFFFILLHLIQDIEHGQLLGLLCVAEMLIVGIVLNLIVWMIFPGIVDLVVQGII